MGRWRTLLPLVAALIAVACSSKQNVATPSPSPSSRATPAQASASASPAASTATAAAASPAPRAAGSPQVSTATAAAANQAESQLVAALLESSDLPSYLRQNSRQPLSNRDFAALQPPSVAAAFEQQLNSSGRIDGAILNCGLPPGTQPDPYGDQIGGVVIILSRYGSPQQASAALPSLVQLVKPTITDPRVFQATETQMSIGQFGDEIVAKMFRTSAILGGAPDTNLYAVGVRRGAVDELYIITGLGNNPSLDAVRSIVSKQDGKLAQVRF